MHLKSEILRYFQILNPFLLYKAGDIVTTYEGGINLTFVMLSDHIKVLFGVLLMLVSVLLNRQTKIKWSSLPETHTLP